MSHRPLSDPAPVPWKATDELTIEIGLKPWFTTLNNGLSTVLIKCVNEGMPVDVAEEILKDALSYAIRNGINARPRSIGGRGSQIFPS